jgi:hypothetical protein
MAALFFGLLAVVLAFIAPRFGVDSREGFAVVLPDR